ncbi:MAG: hypothetical protein ACK4FF_05545 [Limnobacter sp.]|uniref:hypothetical protein n=1 Tax=Limnobacter sp. TaxID=2003368 RepID=UPI00391BAD8D
MGRPLSDHAKKLIDYLDATPATLATASRELGIEYSSANKLINRLRYANRVLVLRKEPMRHCKKRVALYAGSEWVKRNQEAA